MNKNSLYSMAVVLALGAAPALAAPRTTKVHGQVQYSFVSSEYLIQTKELMLQVRGSDLDIKQREALDQASAQSLTVVMSLPLSAIHRAWPNQDISQKFARLPTVKDGISQKAQSRVALSGVKNLSWSDNLFLVQAGDKVIQVRRAALTPAQSSSLEKVGIGGRVRMDLPVQAVSVAWALPAEIPNPTLVADEERVEFRANDIYIDGMVLWSWQPTRAIVQSRDLILMFNKSLMSPSSRDFLENPGARASLTIPVAAVEAIWSTDNSLSNLQRGPAGVQP